MDECEGLAAHDPDQPYPWAELWGTFGGRVPGSRLQSFAVGGVIAVVGGLMLASRGMTRGPRAAEAASESTVLDGGRIRIDGEDQRVEVDGDDLYLATRGPTFRFHRVRS